MNCEQKIREYLSYEGVDYFKGIIFYDDEKINLYKHLYFSKFLNSIDKDMFPKDYSEDLLFRLIVLPSHEPTKLFLLNCKESCFCFKYQSISLDNDKYLPKEVLEEQALMIEDNTIDELKNIIETKSLLNYKNMSKALSTDGTNVFIEFKIKDKHKVILARKNDISDFLNCFYKMINYEIKKSWWSKLCGR